MTRLLMPDSLEALRNKLTRPNAPLGAWWAHFTTLARRDPRFFSPYTVLTALVTELPADRELARRAFNRFVEVQSEGLISQDAQFHTHVVSAPLARWTIYYDWVAGTGILSPAEEKAFCNYLLDYTLVFAWAQANSQTRQFDNQLLSNAFAAAVVGYVLGVKRGNSPAARRMFRTGLDVMRHLLNILPPGGYSPEGSTYHEQVVLPVVLLASLFVEEATGQPVPGIKQLLETSCKMIGPGGLLPPWDHYGFQAASIKSGLACLARLTRDPNPLAIMRDRGMWYRTAHPAWDIDDRLWTLVFWPGDVDKGSDNASYPAWMEPEVGGALQDKSTRLRLFQYWDECSGLPSSGRCQVDPNSISLDVNGSPIIVDGYGDPKPDPAPIPEKQALEYVGKRMIESVQEYIFSSWGAKITDAAALKNSLAGNVGGANSLVFDREYWYVPKGPRRGTGEVLHSVGPLQVVRGEAAEYYTDRYDVSSVARSSLLVGGRYGLVTDRVKSATPHTITWQAYVREEARVIDGQVNIDTPEQVHCQIIPLQKGELELTPITGYPRIGDGRSALLRHTIAPTADARIDVLLVPQSNAIEVNDLSDGWRRGAANSAAANSSTVDLRDAYLNDAAPADAPRAFHRSFTFQPEPNRRYFLRVDTASHLLTAAINGKTVATTVPHQRSLWEGSATLLSLIFDVTDALKPGVNTIELSSPFFGGESIRGPIVLLGAVQPVSAKCEPAGPGAFRVTTASGADIVLGENRDGLVDWAGGKTDARYAVFTADGEVAGAAVRRLAIPGVLELVADAPCDLAWNTRETHLTRFVAGSALQLSWQNAAAELRIQTGGCLDVTYLGPRPHQLIVDLQSPQNVFVNGVSLGVKQGIGVAIALPVSNASASPALPKTVDEAFALIQQPRQLAVQAVIALLRGDDWRLQVAAADVAGVMHLSDAATALLEKFNEGAAELPYPPLKTWWSASKMLRNPGSIEGDDPTVPLPLGIKRWRVRCATAIALGKIGDQRAVTPIEAAMAKCTDFFPVTSQLAVALGRLGAASSIPVLERHFNHAEVNTKLHARLALALLKGEITRDEFESRAGLA